jgi:hypothetical protein
MANSEFQNRGNSDKCSAEFLGRRAQLLPNFDEKESEQKAPYTKHQSGGTCAE